MNKNIFLVGVFLLSILFVFSNVFCSEKQKDLPNIIIITIDSLRPDHMGCYGYYRNTTPNIDKFSENAVIFQNAISQAPYTTDSMASFITGIYPSIHLSGSNSVLLIPFCKLNPCSINLSQVLKDSGYKTCFVSDHRAMFFINGLSRGFDHFVQIKNPDGHKVLKNILEFIESYKDEPVFIWAHFNWPHHPYFPNYSHLIKEPLKRKDEIVSLADNDREIFGAIPVFAKKDGIKSLNYYINGYDGKIRMVDEVLGKLFNGLKKEDAYDNSLIILAADHGEEFGEHGIYCRHGYDVYNTLISVPLLIKLPLADNKRVDITEYVGLIDIFPTLMEFLNIDNNTLVLQGESFIDLLNNKKTEKERFVISELFSLSIAVISDSWKLIVNDFSYLPFKAPKQEYELYNLKDDPYEKDNVVDDANYKDVFNNLYGIFNDEYKSDRGSVRRYLFKCWKDDGVSTESGQLDDLEVLKSLGYMQ